MNTFQLSIESLALMCEQLAYEAYRFGQELVAYQAELESLQEIMAEDFLATGYVQAKVRAICAVKQQFIQRVVAIESFSSSEDSYDDH